MINKLLFALCLQAACMVAAAAPINQISWEADTGRAVPYRITCYRGESIGLTCGLYSSGQPVDLRGCTATMYWQTNGMDSTWWKLPASIISNRVSVTYSPDMQPAAPSVLFFFGAEKGTNGISYRANGQIRLVHAPGALPNYLPIPQQSIDFDTVTVLNPPWATQFDIDMATNSVVKSIDINAVGTNGEQFVTQDFILNSDSTPPGLVSSKPPKHFKLSSDNLFLQSSAYMNVLLDYSGIYWGKDSGTVSGTDQYPQLGISRYSIYRLDFVPNPDIPFHSRPVESTFLFPVIEGTNTLAVTCQVEEIVENKKKLHWDDSAGILWKTSFSNGFIIVTAITNTPTITQ